MVFSLLDKHDYDFLRKNKKFFTFYFIMYSRSVIKINFSKYPLRLKKRKKVKRLYFIGEKF